MNTQQSALPKPSTNDLMLPPAIGKPLLQSYFKWLCTDDRFLHDLQALYHEVLPIISAYESASYKTTKKDILQTRYNPALDPFMQRWQLPFYCRLILRLALTDHYRTHQPLPECLQYAVETFLAIERNFILLALYRPDLEPDEEHLLNLPPIPHPPVPPQLPTEGIPNIAPYDPTAEPVEAYARRLYKCLLDFFSKELERQAYAFAHRLDTHYRAILTEGGIAPYNHELLSRWKDPKFLDRVARQVYLHLFKKLSWEQIALLVKKHRCTVRETTLKAIRILQIPPPIPPE